MRTWRQTVGGVLATTLLWAVGWQVLLVEGETGERELAGGQALVSGLFCVLLGFVALALTLFCKGRPSDEEGEDFRGPGTGKRMEMDLGRRFPPQG